MTYPGISGGIPSSTASTGANPPAVDLVEAGARALAEARNDDVFTNPKFVGDHWDGYRALYRQDAAAVLTAAFDQRVPQQPTGETPMTDPTPADGRPTPQQVLDLPLPDNDAGATTIRGYLVALLTTLWRENEFFSGKRPFGNGGWEYDLYAPLVKAGWVPGQFDWDGSLNVVDEEAAYRLILAAIDALGAAA